MVFQLHFPEATDSDNFFSDNFLLLLTIWIKSSEKCPLTFFPNFWTGYHYWISGAVNRLWILIPRRVWKYFLPFCKLPLCLMSPLQCRHFLAWCNPTCPVLLLLPMLLEPYTFCLILPGLHIRQVREYLIIYFSRVSY